MRDLACRRVKGRRRNSPCLIMRGNSRAGSAHRKSFILFHYCFRRLLFIFRLSLVRYHVIPGVLFRLEVKSLSAEAGDDVGGRLVNFISRKWVFTSSRKRTPGITW